MPKKHIRNGWSRRELLFIVAGVILVAIAIAVLLSTPLKAVGSAFIWVYLLITVCLCLGASFIIITFQERWWTPWWNSQTEQEQKRLRNRGMAVLAVIFILLVPLGLANGVLGGQSWHGKGTVNLFEDNSLSKNYRLPAEIKVTTTWWWGRNYEIDSVEWPNGGSTDLYHCIISTSNQICEDEDGRSWSIEVVEAPELDYHRSDLN